MFLPFSALNPLLHRVPCLTWDCHCQGGVGVSGLHAPCSLLSLPMWLMLPLLHQIATNYNHHPDSTVFYYCSQHHPLNPTRWCQDSKAWKGNSLLEKVREATGTESRVIWVLALKLKAVASTSTAVACPMAVEEYSGVGKSVGRRASPPWLSVTPG